MCCLYLLCKRKLRKLSFRSEAQPWRNLFQGLKPEILSQLSQYINERVEYFLLYIVFLNEPSRIFLTVEKSLVKP